MHINRNVGLTSIPEKIVSTVTGCDFDVSGHVETHILWASGRGHGAEC